MAEAAPPDWAIVVHGGAREIPPEDRPAFEAGCTRAAHAGRELLERGGSAVDAVVAAIRVLEDDPTFNAGTGSVLNAEGLVECDAALMDGTTLDVGAIGAAAGLRNPISAAALVLREEPVLLVGAGAERYVVERGAERTATPNSPAGSGGGCDTVGCVARDRTGALAAGTSTGGLEGAAVGRVGDSPIPGSGLYADDEVGAVALSGTGEHILRVALASRVLAELPGSTPDEAAATALRRLERVGGNAGVIALDPAGRVGWAYTSPQFAVAWADSEHGVRAFTDRASAGRTEHEGEMR